MSGIVHLGLWWYGHAMQLLLKAICVIIAASGAYLFVQQNNIFIAFAGALLIGVALAVCFRDRLAHIVK